jgi:hypothetical protein
MSENHVVCGRCGQTFIHIDALFDHRQEEHVYFTPKTHALEKRHKGTANQWRPGLDGRSTFTDEELELWEEKMADPELFEFKRRVRELQDELRAEEGY